MRVESQRGAEEPPPEKNIRFLWMSGSSLCPEPADIDGITWCRAMAEWKRGNRRQKTMTGGIPRFESAACACESAKSVNLLIAMTLKSSVGVVRVSQQSCSGCSVYHPLEFQ